MDIAARAPLFDRRFLDDLSQVISALGPAVADLPTSGRQWVFYGSQPLGTSGPESDLDVLLLHGSAAHPPQRRISSWGVTPVTIYVLHHGALAADGKGRRFGGYFALKLFSPFVASGPLGVTHLHETTAHFLGPISAAVAGDAAVTWSTEQVLAHAHLAFLTLHPDAAAYLAALRADPEVFSRVWQHQVETYVPTLQAAGYIAEASTGSWRYTGLRSLPDLTRCVARCAARFWAFGSVCHSADAGFPDHYFTRADARASWREQAAARSFLHKMAGLESSA